jgi:hypothetical protein
MNKTYRITYGSSKIVKEWNHVQKYYAVERRVRFTTQDGKEVELCGHWTVEEE